jgi:hypothetical protein
VEGKWCEPSLLCAIPAVFSLKTMLQKKNFVAFVVNIIFLEVERGKTRNLSVLYSEAEVLQIKFFFSQLQEIFFTL